MNHLQWGRLTLLVGIIFLTGCNSPLTTSTNQPQTLSSETTREPLDITVSILPQEYFVEKIGGDRFKVNVMVGPGDNLHIYEPKPQQLQALSEAEAYVSIGVPFEQAWMNKIKGANSQLLVIDSVAGIEKIEMDSHHHDEEEKKHTHAEENLDPHVWLSPQLVKVQAENIYQGLVKIDPTNQAEYQANLAQFLAQINQLDQQIKQNLTGITNRKFIVFHPAWGYFAREYNLEQVPIEVGGQEPSAAELGELIKEAKQDEIKIIFAQPEFSTQSAETIAQEIGGEVLLITPLARDWDNNLLQVSETFAAVLKK